MPTFRVLPVRILLVIASGLWPDHAAFFLGAATLLGDMDK